jgi:FtsP/CotA-like multicopper oxidase with cupredoxin domain
MRFARGTASVLLPALALLGLAGCGGDDQPASGGTPTSLASQPSSPPVSPSGPATTAPQADVVITATVAGGKITPNTQTVKAKQGQSVMVTVTSDEADELHIHGYDKEVELQPGKPGSVTFTADTKGTFEIETHESGKLVAKLIVS